MFESGFGLDALLSWLPGFIVAAARLSFVVFLMPGVGEQSVPVQFRALLLVALSAAFAGAGVIDAPAMTPLPDFLLLLGGELSIGLFLGVSLRLAIWMLMIAGSIIAQSMGLAQFLGVALEQESQTIAANLLSFAGAAILLSANFHVMAVASLLDLYQSVPVGGWSLIDKAYFTQTGFSVFNFAVLLSWPFVLVNLLYYICMGFINRALPSLMVAFVGAPFMVGAGIILLSITVTGLLIVWEGRVFQIVGWM